MVESPKQDTKAQTLRYSELDFIKMKNFCESIDINMENILFATYITKKGLESRKDSY